MGGGDLIERTPHKSISKSIFQKQDWLGAKPPLDENNLLLFRSGRSEPEHPRCCGTANTHHTQNGDF